VILRHRALFVGEQKGQAAADAEQDVAETCWNWILEI
jgi:hypothetical protein